MHPLYTKANCLTDTVIGGMIEVHKDKGPGLYEEIYEWCLMIELELRGLQVVNQKQINIQYKGHTREETIAI